ncbi:DUF1758 domain-containing protein [Nephila pilipes]|uniref:DUF1758 domain-containing protein n=1 Tax=Nephila pilipes TaxID=299642 RepID=A0A8X6U909_NEPPI|nr:DUF1758 domain-containing protein [Nephila pilipes]
MHIGRIPWHELWELEVLGISDPTRTDKIENDLSDYKEKMKILPSGRYEAELPWKYDSMNLHDNMELTWKRHEKMINKIKSDAELRVDSSFSDSAVPPHHFHLGQDINVTAVQVHLRQYTRDENNKPIKKVSRCRLCSGNPLQIESS